MRQPKYRAKKVWACKYCCGATNPVTSRAKNARTCPHCRKPDAIRCFASKAEYTRLCNLRLRERAGEIRNLEVQPEFPIKINGEEIGKYTADFRYFEGNACKIVEVKGYDDPRHAGYLRRRIVEALYRVKIEVVR